MLILLTCKIYTNFDRKLNLVWWSSLCSTNILLLLATSCYSWSKVCTACTKCTSKYDIFVFDTAYSISYLWYHLVFDILNMTGTVTIYTINTVNWNSNHAGTCQLSMNSSSRYPRNLRWVGSRRQNSLGPILVISMFWLTKLRRGEHYYNCCYSVCGYTLELADWLIGWLLRWLLNFNHPFNAERTSSTP